MLWSKQIHSSMERNTHKENLSDNESSHFNKPKRDWEKFNKYQNLAKVGNKKIK